MELIFDCLVDGSEISHILKQFSASSCKLIIYLHLIWKLTRLNRFMKLDINRMQFLKKFVLKKLSFLSFFSVMKNN